MTADPAAAAPAATANVHSGTIRPGAATSRSTASAARSTGSSPADRRARP